MVEKNWLHESDNNFVGHEQIDTNSDKECESPGRLRDNVEVDNGVEDSGTNKDAESKECGGIGRAGEDVKESKDEEWDDILNIILVCPSHSFNVFIDSSLDKNVVKQICYKFT